MNRAARQRVGLGLIGLILWIIMAVLLLKLFFVVGGITAFITLMFIPSFTIALIVGAVAGLVAVGLVWLIVDGFDAIIDGLLGRITK